MATDTFKFDTPEQAQSMVDALEPYSSPMGIEATIKGTTVTVEAPLTARIKVASAAAKAKRGPDAAKPRADEAQQERTFKFETAQLAKSFANKVASVTGAKVQAQSGLSVVVAYPKGSEGMLIRLWDKVSGVA